MSNGYGFGGMPSPDVVQSRLDLLQKSFPNIERLELQDALKAANWDLNQTISKLRSEIDSLKASFSYKAKLANMPKKVKNRVKAHEALEISDSEEEDEYADNKNVYESDSDNEEGEEERVFDEENLSDDQRRVLKFFNKASPHEMVGIEGCSKKKVEFLVRMRPYEGWGDLVSKIQSNRQLSTDMLNNTIILLKMRDAIARLMDRCEKITDKMANVVEKLTSGDAQVNELTEQPKSIPDGFKLTNYQMIGLNWLVLMHKQSLNGVLADEMGLGKTIQAISFLAHLKELGDEGPHLVVVPSSTMGKKHLLIS